MNRYKTKHPRTGLAIAAFAMTALIIGMTVVVPAWRTESAGHDARTLAEPAPTTRAIEAIVVTAPRVDVAAHRP